MKPTIAIDLAKNVFEIAVSRHPGKVAARRHHKTDRADAKALLEAYRNEEIHPVPVKSVEQQSLAALHRLRSGWLAIRTARINAVRGILRELGLTIPQGARYVVPKVWELIEDTETDIPDPLRLALAEACLEIQDLRQRCEAVCKQIESLARTIPTVGHLLSVPGIGILTPTELVAFVAVTPSTSGLSSSSNDEATIAP